MAQYSTPPGIDPRTGRVTPYKQVLSQDATTGTYKMKDEYTKPTPGKPSERVRKPRPKPTLTP